MSTTQLGAQATFEPMTRRRAHAEMWLEGVLADWSVQPGLAGRWLASAERHMNAADPLTLRAEYDQQLSLFTFEVWRDGERVFGIDDWIG